MDHYYDIIVVGGGHAGVEAALAAARRGKSTLLLTMNISTIAQMSCNPAIGGLAKGHLVRELDALGGEMARAIDLTGIQFKMLNRSKGPAVWSPRAQADKDRYTKYMISTLFKTPNLQVKQYQVKSLLIENSLVAGVVTHTDSVFKCHSVIVCSGTFLNGVIHTGLRSFRSGRLGEGPAEGLTQSLEEMGFRYGRLKTGTPPRLNKHTIDYTRLTIQPGEENPSPFRFYENLISLPQVPCYLTGTLQVTHDIISTGLDRSPIYTGVIDSTGPRYCPSVEDKIVRFADKDSHQIFLEPEGLDSDEIYANGFSTSLPEDIQLKAIRTIPGLEHVEITRLGYAIEYDFFYPDQTKYTMETKLIENLYFAGQINGTSGYEEAAVQGFIASINAVNKINQHEPVIFRRDESYIGVLVDDLVSKGTDEPYRMFTSRAEFRLLLRQDNADERMMPYGRRFGLIDDDRWSHFERKYEGVHAAEKHLTALRPTLEQRERVVPSMRSDRSESWSQLLKRPEITLLQLTPLLTENEHWHSLNLTSDQLEQVEIRVKYDGYIQRQIRQAANFIENESKTIPEDIDYDSVKSISNESREKLKRVKPRSLGQASRISGVTPADISVLMVYMKRHNVPHGTSK